MLASIPLLLCLERIVFNQISYQLFSLKLPRTSSRSLSGIGNILSSPFVAILSVSLYFLSLLNVFDIREKTYPLIGLKQLRLNSSLFQVLLSYSFFSVYVSCNMCPVTVFHDVNRNAAFSI